MISVKNLFDELDYWTHIGIADDIVKIPDQRPEYQHLVSKAKLATIEPENIPILVLSYLLKELEKPWYMRPTFWVLLKLKIKKYFL